MTLKAAADAKAATASKAYEEMIAAAAKSTAAPKLEKEADDIIADANQILNGLKAADDAKEKKSEEKKTEGAEAKKEETPLEKAK